MLALQLICNRVQLVLHRLLLLVSDFKFLLQIVDQDVLILGVLLHCRKSLLLLEHLQLLLSDSIILN